MSELLDKLVITISKDIEEQKSYIKTIPRPKTFIRALEEIRDIIGNETIKESIFTQLSHILSKKKRELGESKKPPMLNILFYGPPGTGKTLVATKLAKLWWSLGYLNNVILKRNRSKNSNLKHNYRNSNKEPASKISNSPFSSSSELFNGDENDIVLIMAIINTIIIIITVMWSFISGIYEWIGWKGVLIVFLLIGIVAMIAIDIFLESLSEEEDIYQEVSLNELEEDEDVLESSDSLITIVSREDFVDRYAGWTDKKTLNLLNRNRGKVLFVDEAYSLCNGPRDTYGMEALNCINLFMSQHPDEIIIIFAGYKDLIEKRIFRVQPGLKRRFMWYFDCCGYSPSELFSIFQEQLKHKQLELENRKRVLNLFYKYSTLFENYGGDTERLSFFCEIEHAKDIVLEEERYEEKKREKTLLDKFLNLDTLGNKKFMSKKKEEVGEINKDKISVYQFKRALSKLKQNRIKENQTGEENKRKNWLNQFMDDLDV
jgi:DNA polymerase III delta prime subunit